MTQDFLAARYIPKGATCIRDKATDAVAYLLDRPHKRTGKPITHLLCYCGKRAKPDLNYVYSKPEIAHKAIAEYFAGRKASLDAATERRAKQNVPSKLQVGTVLTGSWGYEQTNVEAYQVVEIVGNRSVKLRPVALTDVSKDEGCAPMAGYVIPCPDQFVGEEVHTKTVTDGSTIRMGHCWLRPWDGRKLYSSWYA